MVARWQASSISKSVSPNPAVCDSFVPGFRIFALADDHIETVILQVQRLSRSLNAVADDGDGLALKHFERFAQRKLFAGDNVLLDAAEIHFCHDFSDLILQLVYFFVCPDFKWSRSPVCLPETQRHPFASGRRYRIESVCTLAGFADPIFSPAVSLPPIRGAARRCPSV